MRNITNKLLVIEEKASWHMERENLGKLRDSKLEAFKSNLDNIVNETQKKELKVQFEKIMELIFLVDAEKGLENHNKNKIIKQLFFKILEKIKKKRTKHIVLSFSLGVLCALIPTLIYIMFHQH